MKGIIFNVAEKAVTELLGPDAWDDLLEDADLDGDYTALGTYPDDELLALVSAAATKTGHDPADVQRLVGRHALPHLVASIEDFLDPDLEVFEFLESVHSIIHVEVKKLDPLAKPPDIGPVRVGDLCGVVGRVAIRDHHRVGLCVAQRVERCAEVSGFVERRDDHRDPHSEMIVGACDEGV